MSTFSPRYLQHFIRAAAHERGFKADIEYALGAGAAVDVALEAAGMRIACEISISTDAEHEASNVAKCLDGGFHAVWLVVAKSRRKKLLAAKFVPEFASGRVAILTPEEVLAALDELSATSPVASSVRGYSVSVKGKALSADEAARKREAVAAILAKSLKGPKR